MSEFSAKHPIVLAASAVAALVAITVVAVLNDWGAAQLGTVGSWVFGLVTLAALALAVVESKRSERIARQAEVRVEKQRQVDHEISRRRECIRAATDVWTAVISRYGALWQTLDGLEDALNDRVNGRAITDRQAETVLQDAYSFVNEWSRSIESSVQYALVVCSSSPIDHEVRELAKALKQFTGVMHNGLSAPSIESINIIRTQYLAVTDSRQGFLDKMRSDLSLDLSSIREALVHEPSGD